MSSKHEFEPLSNLNEELVRNKCSECKQVTQICGECDIDEPNLCETCHYLLKEKSDS